MITLENLFDFFEFIAEENTYIQHTPGSSGSANRFSRFPIESATGQLSNLGFPRLEVVQLPTGLFNDFDSSQQDVMAVRVRVIYRLPDKHDYNTEVTYLDNSKKALMQMLAYILDAQEDNTASCLLCAFDLSTARYNFIDKATFSGTAVGCELSINFKQYIDWENVTYGDFPQYDGTIALPNATGSYVLRLLNGVYSWVTAAAGTVTSVNSQTGDVVLDADDIAETASRFWLTIVLKNTYNAAAAWIVTNGTNLLNHLSNTSNPHQTTLEQARNQNNQITGNIDANGNQIDNLVNPSSAQQAATKAYTDAAQAAAETYADQIVQSNIKIIGDWDAGSGFYPKADESNTTPFIAQWGSTIKAGWAFRVGYGQPGTVDGYYYENGDVVYALVDNPSDTDSTDWGDLDHNLQQATESTRGTSKIATAVIVANENTLDDEAYVTGKKLWLNFWTRVLAIAHTFAAKITFTTAPRFSSATASKVLAVDSNKDLTTKDTDSTVTAASTNLVESGAVASYAVKKSAAATGTTIDFTATKVFNSVASPATGNISEDLTGAETGVVQKIYHNHSSAPTFPAGWVKISGAYVTSSLNIIYAEWVSGTRVEYWIVTL